MPQRCSVDLTRNQANACLKMLLQGLQSEPGWSSWSMPPQHFNCFDSAALAVLLGMPPRGPAPGRDDAPSGDASRLRIWPVLRGTRCCRRPKLRG